MKHILVGPSVLCFVLGCASPEIDASAALAISKAPHDFVARRIDGDLVIASGASGAVRDAVSVQGALRDVAWDPWTKRVIVVAGDEDEEGGEIAAHALTPRRFGARSHVAWIDGRAALLPTPHGTIVFEQSYGERWKLLGAAPTPSVFAPPPVSAWITLGPEGTLVHGFRGNELREAKVSAAGIGAPAVHAIAISPSISARIVPVPARGGDAILACDGASMAIRIARGEAVGPASIVPLASDHARIEASIALEGGAVVVALLAHPSAIAAALLDESGAASSVAEIALPGDVANAAPFPSRDLVALGAGRVITATNAGVFALRVTHGATGIHLDLATGFEGNSLRGPLAAISPSP